jgi:hypothetical protein
MKRCLVSCLVVAMSYGFTCSGALAATLVNLWSFENNFLDTSGNGNNGTSVTGAPTFVPGQFGQAVSIGSGDGVKSPLGTPINLPLSGASAWSMNLWAKFDTAPGVLQYLAGFGSNTDYTAYGQPRGIITYGGGASNDFYFWGASDVDSGVTYSADGQWHMYTVTHNGSAIQMYKDGTPIFGSPVLPSPIPLVDTFDEIQVGNPSVWSSTFQGALDEFSIFAGELSQSQVDNLYTSNNISAPEPSTLSGVLFMVMGSAGCVTRRRAR